MTPSPPDPNEFDSDRQARVNAETLGDQVAPNAAHEVTIDPDATPPQDTPDATGGQFGRFVLRQRLGQGAFGIVYRAHDPQLDREVALKVSQTVDLSEDRLARFRSEARAVANLRHPCIVPLFEAGVLERRFYLLSALIPGVTLHDFLQKAQASGGLPTRDAARIVQQLAEALHYAHGVGTVHRDVKSANVMIDPTGTPHLLDFGLAVRARGDASDSISQSRRVGTPAYMAPEVVQADATRDDSLADQYSLGIVLYELICGRVPFSGPTEIVYYLHVQEPPPEPRGIRADVSADLVAICLKCLAKSPAGRYANCGELHADLGRFLAGEPTRARPVSLATRWAKWARRKPSQAGALFAAICLVASLVTFGFIYQNEQLKRERAINTTDRKARAQELIDSLTTLDSANLVSRSADLDEAKRETPEHVATRLADARTPREILRYSALVLPESPQQLDAIERQLAQAEAGELRYISNRMSLANVSVTHWFAKLKTLASDQHAMRLRVASLLAQVEPKSTEWEALAKPIAESLLQSPLSEFGAWQVLFAPISKSLAPEFATVAIKDPDPVSQFTASQWLKETARSEPMVLLRLARSSPPEVWKQLRTLFTAAATDLAPLWEQHSVGDSHPERASQAITRYILGQRSELLANFNETRLPDLQTYTLKRLADCGVSIAGELDRNNPPAVLRACLLACGEDPSLRSQPGVLAKIETIYRTHPNAGVHSSARWALQQQGITAGQLTMIDAELVVLPANTEREWQLTPHGRTFSVVGPATYTMGRSATEPPVEFENETAHQVNLKHRFAVGVDEVRRDDFMKFFDAHPEWNDPEAFRFPVGVKVREQIPMHTLHWYEAVAYCRWRSEQDGIPENQQCYPDLSTIWFRALEPSGPAIDLPVDYQKRRGYRLPTEAEWEYAARSGSMTSYSFGNDSQFLPRYGLSTLSFSTNFGPVQQFRPNMYGLFDVHGNLWEWTQDGYRYFRTQPQTNPLQSGVDVPQILRGGAWDAVPRSLRSSQRAWNLRQAAREYSMGMRMVYSVPTP